MMTTPLTPEQLGALHADLHPARVAKRSQGNATLSYMEAYDVKAMLIRVFGYAGFSADCLDARIIREEHVRQGGQAPDAPNPKMNWSITAQAMVRITIHQTGATYTETAIATNSQPQYGEAADTALKSAESDALKRAAIYLGSQFGLSLYRNGQTRDVVSRVFAPGQSEATQLIVAARDESNPDLQQAAASKLARLQQNLKVHQAQPEPTPEPTEPAPAVQDAPKAPPARKVNAARKALADAEAAAGVQPREGQQDR